MGKSGHVARKIAATLASTGQPASFVHPAEASHGDLGMLQNGDVVLALSWSGETAELAAIVTFAKRYAIPLIAMTASPDSALGREADVCLALPSAEEACPNGLAPTTSTTMQLALGDALAIALLEGRGFTARDFRVLHPGGKLGAKLTHVRDVMHTGERVPRIAAGAPDGRGDRRDVVEGLRLRRRCSTTRPARRHRHRRRPAPPPEARILARHAGRRRHDAEAAHHRARRAGRRGAGAHQPQDLGAAGGRGRRRWSASCISTTSCASARSSSGLGEELRAASQPIARDEGSSTATFNTERRGLIKCAARRIRGSIRLTFSLARPNMNAITRRSLILSGRRARRRFASLAPAEAATGSISISIASAGFIFGATIGNGALRFQGTDFRLRIGGISAGAIIGASATDLVGTAYHLHQPADIEGIYSAIGAGMSVAGGRSVAQLHQFARGVVPEAARPPDGPDVLDRPQRHVDLARVSALPA